MTSILIIDDDPDMQTVIGKILSQSGYDCHYADHGELGIAHLKENDAQIVITDLRMPGIDGLEVLSWVKQNRPETQVLLITADATVESAVDALRQGAADYVSKPINLKELAVRVSRLVEQANLNQQLSRLRREISRTASGLEGFVGNSPAIQKIRDLIVKVADTRTTVLIAGETGTGKEVVARSIHATAHSDSPAPFVAVNCAAIPEHLVESELFGHSKGAFTGADRDKPGLIEESHGGTLFLDEIGDMPAAAQAKLLRVLEERCVQRLGANKPVPVDVRVIAASNHDLAARVSDGVFREDLLYRLRVVEIDIPPLREHPEDIPVLAELFCRHLSREMKLPVHGFSNSALTALRSYAWPGNVRELKNVIERAILFAVDGVIAPESLPRQIAQPEQLEIGGDFEYSYPDDLSSAVAEFERRHIQSVLEKTDGKKSPAAKLLGVDRSTLYRKLES